ncbi:hypothetical protein [Calothrix sp. UHCC 0171]|uniref:hypothetical protein n=1 Tax=Calothrix sp. UHCC 0171 TaxID=3110245 RepID=UPI002B206582|nr:hypothetical protein [Calothrix sp. UHCC 0171]MEA5569926.1 hypothetical protein [Calothrix sp. UHCC 0171]
MLVSNKYIIIPVSLSVTLLLTSCSESKVSQCERLIKEVKAGTALLENNKGAQVSTSLKLAQDLEEVTKTVRELNLGDEKLKEYQSRIVKVFNTLSQNIGKAGKALGSAKTAQASIAGRERIQKARENIDSALETAASAAKEFDNSVNGLNDYCSKP